MSYNPDKKIKELQQIICNIVNYVLWLYEKKFISDRTKDEILKICNGYHEDEQYRPKAR